jgi:hypothetical protein
VGRGWPLPLSLHLLNKNFLSSSNEPRTELGIRDKGPAPRAVKQTVAKQRQGGGEMEVRKEDRCWFSVDGPEERHRKGAF